MGPTQLGESCSKCRYVLQDRDKWYSCCFRCLATLCKWCSNEEWKSNGERLILDVAQQRNTVLADGPLRAKKSKETCDFQLRGMCFAGRFCNYTRYD